MSKFEPITSSNLKEAKYDAENQILTVRFRNETTYEYPAVDSQLWSDFEKQFDGENGNSAGRFFNKNIRHRPFKKIEG